MLITLLIILIKTTILTILEKKNCTSNEWGNQTQSLGHTTIDSLVAEHFIRNSSGQYIYIPAANGFISNPIPRTILTWTKSKLYS